MNSKLRLVSITAALLLSIEGGAQVAYVNARPERMAQTQRNKSALSRTDKNKTAPAAGCSLLTPALLEKVLGQPFKDDSEGAKMPPAYEGGAWGSSCEYSSQEGGNGVRVDFLVYVEASDAEAKRTFDKAAVFFIDNSRAKPSIGDSAYWSTISDKKEPYIHVLKGKVHFQIGMVPANEKQLKDLAAAVAARV
ncbi:MAG TPA: hypothetical protein VJO16_07935 [Candidatus Acidoferrum sp.]|nr:hypothetical protein [Candidatus Acidoferrum sp.]